MSHSPFATLRAMLRQRCPVCRSARMFRGPFSMYDTCPACDVLFQREEGYFLRAMYVSYGLGLVLVAPLYFFIDWLLPGWHVLAVNAVVTAVYVLFVPLIFQYSRVGWIYLDRSVCPSDVSAGVYEKRRQHELAHRHPGDEK